MYISVEWIELAARFIGWEAPGTAATAERALAAKDAEIRDLRAQVGEADRFAEAAEYTLGRFGSKVRGKPGRKPAEKQVA